MRRTIWNVIRICFWLAAAATIIYFFGTDIGDTMNNLIVKIHALTPLQIVLHVVMIVLGLAVSIGGSIMFISSAVDVLKRRPPDTTLHLFFPNL